MLTCAFSFISSFPSVLLLLYRLGESAKEWADLKKIIRSADFIKNVISFDVNQLNEKTRAHIIKNYVNDPNFAFDVVNNASKACGPLVKWSGDIDYETAKKKMEERQDLSVDRK